MLRFEDSGWRDLERLSAESLLAEVRPLAVIAVRRGAVYLSGQVKITLSGGRTGRIYKVSKTGKWHVASSPGEAPAVLFDNLRTSVGNTEPEWSADGLTCFSEVGPGIGQAKDLTVDPGRTYARRLEFGGVDSRGVMLEARPYMEPTVVRCEARVDAILEEELGK